MSEFDSLRVPSDTPVRLADHDPRGTPGATDKGDAKDALKATVDRISDLQEVLWAENKRSVLVVLQGMDTAGKDGLIRGVFSGVNPQGCKVHGFKAPTAHELDHDFLWRVHAHTPPRGEIGVFNRSHYEDVLIARVKELVTPEVVEKRYRQINEFERHLTENGTVILKLFLHISKEEQRERLQARVDDPSKWWKMSKGDIAERKLWDDYQRAYELALENCSPPHAPWHIVPSDRKWYRNLAAAQLLADALERMDLKFPKAHFDPRTLVIE
jgi:PPK2 family polyphosphate:nucleotide phosphotransferase